MPVPAVRYTPEVEDRVPDEAETIEKLNKTFDIILERTAEDYGHAVRSVHAKSHGILEGEMTVHDGLPAELAQGLFARPGRHKVYLRMSTNAGDILPDAISLPRGLAMKVLDVEGDRLPGAEGTAQDFVMVNGKVFQGEDRREVPGQPQDARQDHRPHGRAPRSPFRRRCAASATRSRRSARSRPPRSIRWVAHPMSSRSARPTIRPCRSATATISPSSAWPRSRRR